MAGRKGFKRHRYTDEQIEYLRKRRNAGRSKLTERFNAEFGTALSVTALRGTMKRLGFLSNRDGRFKPGDKPWNTGVKGYKSVSPETTFKKGSKPHNWLPVGSERISKEGYLEIKTAEPNKWTSKHRQLWEQHHARKVPKGSIVIFLDGDNRNFAIENLRLIPRAVNGPMSKRGLHRLDPEFKDVMINVVELEIRTKAIEHGKDRSEKAHLLADRHLKKQ